MGLVNLDPAFVQTSCASCGIVFWVGGTWDRDKRERGTGFWCPNGHTLSYGKSEADKLREQLKARDEQLARERTRSDQKDRANAALRGQVTKIKNRIQHGVCPCCNRTFQNVMRHMATKHPDWKGQEIG